MRRDRLRMTLIRGSAGLFVAVALPSAAAASAADEPAILVDVRGSDRTATYGGLLQHVDIEVRAQGFDVPGVDRKEHKFHSLWQRIQERAGAVLPGDVRPGLTTGFGVSSLRVSFSAWPEGKPLIGRADPDAWASISNAVEAFQNYHDEQAELPPEEREGAGPERRFMRFFHPGGAFAFRAAWFCAALPYVTEVRRELGVVPSLQRLESTWCDASYWGKPQTFIEDDFGSLPSELGGTRERTPDEILFNARFADKLVSFWRPSLDICGAERIMDAGYVKELLDARWVPPSIVRPSGISASEFEQRCSETLGKVVVARTVEALRHWARQGRVLGHSPWLTTVLGSLALEQRSQWRTAERQARSFVDTFAGHLTMENGYTEAKLVPERDLNVKGMLEEAGAGQRDGQKLWRALLLPLSPRNRLHRDSEWLRSPYVMELRQADHTPRGKYLDERLERRITAACARGRNDRAIMSAQCLYDSVTAISSQDVARIEVHANGAPVQTKYGISGASQ